jgi:predicted nucleic acid-binding protein
MLVDTNVLVDVLENDPTWADWSIAQLRAQAQIHRLVINPVIYAELSLTFSTVEALDATLADLQIPVIETPKPAQFLAGKAFVQYRRETSECGGTPTNVLADFFIGAHAAVAGLPVLTRDVRRYASYFPTVRLIAPGTN